MGEATKAVFLSYSSEDAEAARRICESLRTVGLEVWFDQNELRGGDAWDARIRRQIRDCALFVPIVSTSTDARSEGYFRLEWKLAVDRSHQMADDQAFLMPVVIDATAEATARVPDRFRERQWSRLAGGESATAFAERLLRLLSGGSAAAAPAARAAAAPARTETHSPGESASIAVLPFVNMSRDEENEYFADGLSEELLNLLSRIRGLRVASRTSAFFFKGKNVDIPTIAQKLNVATVLEGSVRKSGKRVRITAQLIEVASDSHLWSQTYDRELEDIFAVQDDIAQAVVAELRGALVGASKDCAPGAQAQVEVKAAAPGRATDPEAYRLYLQGRFFIERMTGPDLARSVEYFQQAVAIDPEFALAWTGLSAACNTQAGYGWMPVAEGYERAREAAQRALAIAPDLAEGHVALGLILQMYDWNWQAADAELRRALALAPGNALVLRALGNLAGMLGRREESLSLLRQSAALDPLSAIAHRLLGLRCVIYGELDEGESELRKALDLQPNAGLIHCFLSAVPLFRGEPALALELARREVLPEFRLFGIALAEQSLGNAAAADVALAGLIEEFGDVMAFQVAEVAAWRGEKERAFEWLERAYVQRDPGLSHLLTDCFLPRVLQGDPRWAPFLKKMGFA